MNQRTPLQWQELLWLRKTDGWVNFPGQVIQCVPLYHIVGCCCRPESFEIRILVVCGFHVAFSCLSDKSSHISKSFGSFQSRHYIFSHHHHKTVCSHHIIVNVMAFTICINHLFHVVCTVRGNKMPPGTWRSVVRAPPFTKFQDHKLTV